MRILITGANGQLGQEFSRLPYNAREETIFWTRQDVDICDHQLEQKIKAVHPTHLINCAAYTAVDLAESQPERAFMVNADAVANLAEVCTKLNIPMIHFSSDYVYHNHLRRPLEESDPTRPKGVYAKSKLKGEQFFMGRHPYPLIFRVSWLYSTFGNNFPKTILGLASKREQLNVVKDQVGAPTYAKDVAEMVIRIIRNQRSTQDWKKISGIYNYSNEGLTNWYEMASFIVRFSQLNCQINPIPSRDFPTAASRPRYSKLNLSKFRVTFGNEIRDWQDAMEECLMNLQTKDC